MKFPWDKKESIQNNKTPEADTEILSAWETFQEQIKDQYEKSRDVINTVYDSENDKFKDIINNNLIISVYGPVNAGKSSCINALMDKDIAEVSGVAGWTKDVMIYHYDENVIITDTPGLADCDTHVSDIAIEHVHKNADIVIFFFKATGFEKHHLDAFLELKKHNTSAKIIPVVSYCDIWYEKTDGAWQLENKNAQDEVLGQMERALGIRPIPISSYKDINIDLLDNDIDNYLKTIGKELLYARQSRSKDEKVEVYINSAAGAAAGVAIIPIPGSDIVGLTSLQVGLAMKIAYVYNEAIEKGDIMQLIGATVTGSIGKQVSRWVLSLFKVTPAMIAVTAINAGIASAITYAFGKACQAYYKSGKEIGIEGFLEVYKSAIRYKKSNS